jgi:hypothetical protein
MTKEGRPNNLDLSSLKPLPGKREVGWGVKKIESQSKLESLNPDQEQGLDNFDVPLDEYPRAIFNCNIFPLLRGKPKDDSNNS